MNDSITSRSVVRWPWRTRPTPLWSYFFNSMAKDQRRPRTPWWGAHLWRGLAHWSSSSREISTGGPMGGGPIMPGVGAPWPIGGEEPPQPGEYWVGAPANTHCGSSCQSSRSASFLWGHHLLGWLTNPTTSPASPGAWEHQLGFLCQQPCLFLGLQQLQQVALRQCQYLWEEVPLPSLRPGSLLEAASDQGLAALLFLLVWSSLAWSFWIHHSHRGSNTLVESLKDANALTTNLQDAPHPVVEVLQHLAALAHSHGSSSDGSDPHRICLHWGLDDPPATRFPLPPPAMRWERFYFIKLFHKTIKFHKSIQLETIST